MTVSGKYLGFAALILLGVILAFSPIDEMSVKKVTTDELLHQLHNQSSYITADEVAHMIIDKDPSFQIIDIRSQEDFKAYSIPGSFNLPIGKLFVPEAADLIDPDKNLVLVSNGNTKAGQAWILMRSNGYEDVFVLQGGMNYWVNVFSNPKQPDVGAVDDEIFRYQFRKSAGPIMMGQENIVASSGSEPEKPKPVKRVRKKKKKQVDEGC
jgi:rhodanese-related sulfurtransferase